MSDPRYRLIRAARVLSEAVKIGGAALSESEAGPSDHQQSDELDERDLLKKDLEDSKALCLRLQRDLDQAKAAAEETEGRIAQERRELEQEKKGFLEQLEKDREKAKKDGFEEGKKKGREEGFTEGRSDLEAEIKSQYEKELSGTVEILNKVHSEMRSNLEELLAENPYRLIRLWQKVLSRLLVREVAFDQEAALRLVKDLLSRASEKEDVRVYLNPDDLNSIEAQKGSFGDIARGIRNIEFLPDDEVDKGSCIVETGLGIYDARWRTQLEQIGSEIEGVLTEGKNRE